MSDLYQKILKVQEWQNSCRVLNSLAKISISGGHLVFFSVNIPRVGMFADLLNLAHCSDSTLQSEMEARLRHMERIAKRYFNHDQPPNIQEKNGKY